jgi:hypothetical protein
MAYKRIIGIVCFTIGCGLVTSFAPSNITYQTECVTLETDGYVTIKIWDTKKGSKYKPEQARQDALNALLHSGIAGSNGCVTQPPLLSGADEQHKFKSIEHDFFAKKGKWSMFTRSSAIETTVTQNIGDNSWKVYQVSVSKKELRKYLEERKVIKALNSGF